MKPIRTLQFEGLSGLQISIFSPERFSTLSQRCQFLTLVDGLRADMLHCLDSYWKNFSPNYPFTLRGAIGSNFVTIATEESAYLYCVEHGEVSKY